MIRTAVSRILIFCCLGCSQSIYNPAVPFSNAWFQQQILVCWFGSSFGLLGDRCIYPNAIGQNDTVSNLNVRFGTSIATMKLAFNPLTGLRERVILSEEPSGRVRIWNRPSAVLNTIPDAVIGAADVDTTSFFNNSRLPEARIIGGAYRTCSCGGQIFVTDSNFNRVLVWNEPVSGTYPSASFVLGQPDFTSSTANNGGLGPSSLNTPEGIDCYQNRLYVGDSSNGRILIYSLPVVSNFQAAVGILGKSSYTDSSSGIPAQNRVGNRLADIFVSEEGLYLTDTLNYRVLGWNLSTLSDGAPAKFVLGQADFVSGGIAATSGNTLSSPSSVFVGEGKLLVSDSDNNRMIGLNTIPNLNGSDVIGGNFDFILGQPNAANGSVDGGLASIGPSGMSNPSGGFFSGGDLYVMDGSNSRIAVWNQNTLSYAGTEFVAADRIFGQSKPTTGFDNNGNPRKDSINPVSAATDGTRLYVVDNLRNRILVWNRIPLESGPVPDFVLGQPDLDGDQPNAGGPVGPLTFNRPGKIKIVGGKFLLADQSNERVLVWDHPPAHPADAPALVIGQPNFTTNTPILSPTADSTGSPIDMDTDGTKLAVVDSRFSRVMIWNTFPTLNGASADVVVGRVDFLDNSAAGPPDAFNLLDANGVLFYRGKLIVSDGEGIRIKIWNQIPTANYSPADLVLGQPDMNTAIPNNGLGSFPPFVNERSLAFPYFPFILKDSLAVVDLASNRILVWDTFPTANYAPAGRVIGQPNFYSAYANSTGIGPYSLSAPAGAFYEKERLWIVDAFNYRIISYPY